MKKSSYDPHNFCRHCQITGHDIFVCRKYAALNKNENSSERNSGGNQDGSSLIRTDHYNPSFVQPYQMSASVTRFIANSSNPSVSDEHWIFDTAANVYITPYKSDLCSYVEQYIGDVKGFGGKLEIASGRRSFTLMDPRGNRITLNNVCYVPSSQDHIISFMKLRREHKVNLQVTGLQTFVLKADNGFSMPSKSINDILVLKVPQLQANAVTRSAAKRSISNVEQSPSDPSAPKHSPALDPSNLNFPAPEYVPLTCNPPDLRHL